MHVCRCFPYVDDSSAFRHFYVRITQIIRDFRTDGGMRRCIAAATKKVACKKMLEVETEEVRQVMEKAIEEKRELF